MVPNFVDGVRLPPGPHQCTWAEILERFGLGEARQALCAELRKFLDRAKKCGFLKVAVGGSFPTAVPAPGDLDLLFVVPLGTDRANLSVECAQLLMNDTAFQRLFGHNGQWCPDDPDVVDALVYKLGLDKKAGKERGLIWVDLTCL